MLPDMKELGEVLQRKLQSDAADVCMLTYGPRRGSKPFREALASFLTQEYQRPVSSEEVMATAGVSHGLDLACSMLACPGDTIAVEAPTYYLASQIFQGCHLQVACLPTDDQGLDTDALASRLEADPAFRPKLLYTIPVHNNPCGTVLPALRRAALVALAHRYGFTILADEVYQMLTFPGAPEPPPGLRAYEDPLTAASPFSRVLSLSSFSKICAPGLRLGWVEGSPHLLDKLAEDGVISSGGCINHFATSMGLALLEAGMVQRHLSSVVRPQLAAQCSALCQGLRRHLPELPFHQPDGGYFVWLPLPNQVNVVQLAAECMAVGVKVHPGHLCGSDGFASCIRVCFSFYSPEELDLGAQRLAACLREHQPLEPC